MAEDFNPDNYIIYYGDLNGDGTSDFYFAQKPLMLVLHGDIAITLPIKRNDHFAIYRNGNGYTNPQAFSLTDAVIAQRLNAGTLRLAVLNNDYFVLNSANNTLLIRGYDASSPGLLIKSASNVAIPAAGDLTTLSTASYKSISDRGVRLRILDINNDGRRDILLGDETEGSSEYAYLADNNLVPSRYFEVFPAISRPTTAATHVGTTAGQFRVDESGAATYSIPINIPEGVAGVTPHVALAYSSGAGNGIAGLGWSLSGLSTISRCRQTLSQDKNPQPISWNQTDRFCLDGQRLILISGSYGAANSTYKTEIDSVIEVKAIGGTTGHPEKFEVKAKDGSVSTYGGTSDSKLFGSTASNSTLTWAISRFEDNMKNAIEYSYEGSAATGQRIKNIYYAYSTTATTTRVASGASAKVEFNYQDSRPDTSFSYVTGFKFSQQSLLKDIRVYNADSLGIMNLLRSYNLSYMLPTVVANRFDRSLVSRLVSVQECRDGACYSPLSFEWGGGTHLGFSALATQTNAARGYLGNPVFADFSGDGIADLAYISYNASGQVFVEIRSSTDTNYGGIEINMFKDTKAAIASIDYNVDGRMDLAFKRDGKWFVALSLPDENNNWQIDSNSSDHIIALSDEINSITTNPAFVDINSDGVSDVVFGGKFKLLKRNAEPDSSFKAYSFDIAKNFSVDYSALNGTPLTLSRPDGASRCDPIRFNGVEVISKNSGDFNGDGRVDFLVRAIARGECWFDSQKDFRSVSFSSLFVMTVSGSEDAPTLIPFASLSGLMDQSKLPSNYQTTDINGDGLTDLVQEKWVSADLLLELSINNGRGFDSPVLLHKLVGYTKDRSPQFIDVNNDGVQDIVTTNQNLIVSFVKYEKNTSNQWVYSTTAPSSRGTSVTGASQFLMDVSGDGILDRIALESSAIKVAYGQMSFSGTPLPCEERDYGRGGRVCVPLPIPSTPVPVSQQHNAIYRIHNGLGGVTEVAYGTLANSGHYSTLDVDLTSTPVIVPGGCSYNQYFEEECYDDYTINHVTADKFYERLNGGWALPADSYTLIGSNNKKDKPVLEVNGSMQIVTSVESSAPIKDQPNARSKVEYKYSEAKIQASGRGFLGFARLTTIDTQTKVETVTAYRQDFPFIGSPISTTVYSDGTANRKVLSHSYNRWNVKQPVEGIASYSPYI